MPASGPHPLQIPAMVVATAAAALWAFAVSSAYLINLEGPMGDGSGPAPVLAAVASTAAVAGVVLLAVRALAHLGTVAAIGAAALVVVGAVVLAPTVVDTHESFVERPDRIATCRGWEFAHYPPGQSDGSVLDYCVGIEDPIEG